MRARFLIFIVLVAIAEYYSFIVVRSALRTLPQAWRIGILTAYVVLSLASWSGILLFNFISWEAIPHMIRNMYVAFTFGLMLGKIIILIVMLGDELRRLGLWIIGLFAHKPEVSSAGKGIPRSIFIQRTALILGATLLGGMMYGFTNRYRYSIRRVKIKSPNLPAAFRGLKIVQVSDIHSGSFDSKEAVARGVKMVMDEKPDIIFFTGDLVNNKSEEITPYIDIFSKFSAPYGVYSTLGNHDYGDYVQWPSREAKTENLDTLKKYHSEMGWRLLLNEHVVLEKGEDKIAVIGVENWGAKAGFPKYGKMADAYAGLPEKNIPYKILLSHDPSHWDAQVRPEYPDVDLTLSGHTHGMQLGIEIPGFKWSPVQYVYKEWAGLYQEGNQYLYVNRGFGFLGYPGRLGILPEITVIELV